MKNILATSFGTSWPIIPELLGLTNAEQYDFYRYHPQADKIEAQREEFGILPVDEVWLATTQGGRVREKLEKLS